MFVSGMPPPLDLWASSAARLEELSPGAEALAVCRGGSFSYGLERAEVLCKQKPRRGKFLHKIKSVNIISPRSHLNDSKP